MGLVSIICSIVAAIVFFFSLIKPVTCKVNKVEELQKLQEASNLINLDKSSYTKYVLTEPRPYDIFVFYTLSNNCEHCVQMEEELNQVAYSYIQSKMHKPENYDKNPLFFAKIEFNQMNRNLFVDCDFTSVPILTLAKPSLAKRYSERGK
jgi:thiol-disulfide isomerase/thioredoxin